MVILSSVQETSGCLTSLLVQSLLMKLHICSKKPSVQQRTLEPWPRLSAQTTWHFIWVRNSQEKRATHTHLCLHVSSMDHFLFHFFSFPLRMSLTDPCLPDGAITAPAAGRLESGFKIKTQINSIPLLKQLRNRVFFPFFFYRMFGTEPTK